MKTLKHFSFDDEHKYDKISAHLVIADVLVCTFIEKNIEKKCHPSFHQVNGYRLCRLYPSFSPVKIEYRVALAF